MEIKMTTELPTKEGYYWWMAKGKYSDTIKSIHRVFRRKNGKFYVEFSDWDRLVESWEDDSVQYWQYIQEPEIP